MDKTTYSRIPIIYSLAYHSMSYSKDDPNQCAKDFMEHLRRVGCIINKETSSNINNRILKIQDQKTRRELNQACNLELTIDAAEELFPHLMKSKEIKREEVEGILREIVTNRIAE